MTRATYAILNFDIYQSFRYNMLIYTLIPFFIAYGGLKKKGYKKASNIVVYVMLTIAIVFGILRNTSQFRWMAPILVQ